MIKGFTTFDKYSKNKNTKRYQIKKRKNIYKKKTQKKEKKNIKKKHRTKSTIW